VNIHTSVPGTLPHVGDGLRTTLSDLEIAETALIDTVDAGCFGEIFLRRLEAMGLVPGQEVRMLRRAPFGGPLVVRVGMTTEIAIRRSEAMRVSVRCADRRDG
jgi:ferrous iron transport protein A